MKQILKVLVGSRAHDLYTEDSDYDYRGVFIYPTREILALRPPKDQTSWLEGKTDDTSWELHKFLVMACQCNPSVLEVFKSRSRP
jgi:predicted nucleotidyltransferase